MNPSYSEYTGCINWNEKDTEFFFFHNKFLGITLIYYNFTLVFVDLAMVSIGYSATVLTSVFSENWVHSDTTKQRQ